MPSRSVPLAAAVIAALLTSFSQPAAAQEPTKLRFTLDWKLQGIHAWYFWAQEKGYFAAEKLEVTIDQGEGSAATVTRVISGTCDAGFGDVNARSPAVGEVFDKSFLPPKGERMLPAVGN